jgi:hypothetical protein
MPLRPEGSIADKKGYPHTNTTRPHLRIHEVVEGYVARGGREEVGTGPGRGEGRRVELVLSQLDPVGLLADDGPVSPRGHCTGS